VKGEAIERLHRHLMLRPLTIYLPGSRAVLFSSRRQVSPVFFPFGPRFASDLKDTPPINNDIPYTYVRVVDPETRKPLPPRPLADVVNNLTTDIQPKQGDGPPKIFVTQFAQLVAPPSEATNGYALVKLVDRREAAAREKTQRLKAKASRKASEEKEIQFAWSIGAGDVQHKLRKARQELERGARVQLVFARKASRGSQRDSATSAKQNGLVAQVVEELTDVAREWRMRDERRNMVVVYLQDHQRPIPHKSVLAKQATKQAVSST
jgi:translation initiation factor IF-3